MTGGFSPEVFHPGSIGYAPFDVAWRLPTYFPPNIDMLEESLPQEENTLKRKKVFDFWRRIYYA
ncbi:hypothetical protein [Paenibacillus rhizophilus]|uniref:hypothetical protein n=1 Tax=Paenibacillus rhizophilus TaxID=1850366 RepID=UPI0011D00285|nr:hypothetical protein [Paenibacillus rhizophilus]